MRRLKAGERCPPDELGPGRHNPMHGWFGDEIALGVGGPCILGLTDEEARERQREYDEATRMEDLRDG